MNLKLQDVRSINSADIDISKINVIGGVNSSGKSTVSKLLYCYLKSEIDDESFDYLINSEGLSDLNDSNISFVGDFTPSEIFYIDNISVLDLKDLEILRVDHIIHMKEALEEENIINESEILSKIQDIIQTDSYDSAGIKEIGILQIILQNNKLKENSFIIIDEPESSLHPEWEIKYAELLVLLAKELNIHIYLNSHSPMFIEAISLYSQYYDLINEINFYLTERQENGKYNFKKVNPKNMGEVYENLTRPYDELDKIKANILFKE